LMLLSYENRRYLVIVGSSNVMLDSFGEDKIQNEQDFAIFFEENKKKLSSFLEERKNSLSNYKDKMSGEF
ncbi:MAG: excinuclease ABC subunit A, partial [Campylobacter concisus]